MSSEMLLPQYIYTGENALEGASAVIEKMGNKILLVADPAITKLDCFEKVKALLEKLGKEYVIFSDINSEPTDLIVDMAHARYKNNACDCLIAVGGGSAIDTMKAAAVRAATGKKISDFMGKKITAELPFMAAIPTTAGTGSEATRFTVISDTKTDIKMLLGGAPLIPKLAIVDPAFSASSPKGITAASGLDALTHAIESYTSRKAQPMTDTFALSAVKRIFRNLPTAYKDGSDIRARTEMSLAALEAGIAINNASVTIVHGMSRPIGALFHVPHGISNAMLLEKCLGFALDGAYERFAELAKAIGAAAEKDSDKAAAEKLIAAIHELCAVCEVPTLEEYGINKSKFFASMDKMASDALDSGSPANTIKPVSKADILEIYRSLW